MTKPWVRTTLAALMLAILPCAHAADATAWPEKPVRLIVPFAAGGATDLLARRLAPSLQAAWKQPVVIENIAGAGTVIGTQAAARAAPDGYTLAMVVSSHVINPSLRSNLPYDTVKDLAPISHIASQQLVLAANPAFKADTVAQLVAMAKAQPGAISYATPGAGTAMHLTVELLKVTAGIDLVHVPYKGGVNAQQDVVGGQVPLLLDVYYSAAPLIKAGRLKTIALLAPKPVATVPGIPVIADTVPGVSAVSMIGMVAPAGTPKVIIDKVSADIARIVHSPAFVKQFAELGMEPVGSTPEAFDVFIRQEIAKWAPVVKASGARID